LREDPLPGAPAAAVPVRMHRVPRMGTAWPLTRACGTRAQPVPEDLRVTYDDMVALFGDALLPHLAEPAADRA
jgi:hypothetical protein